MRFNQWRETTKTTECILRGGPKDKDQHTQSHCFLFMLTVDSFYSLLISLKYRYAKRRNKDKWSLTPFKALMRSFISCLMSLRINLTGNVQKSLRHQFTSYVTVRVIFQFGCEQPSKSRVEPNVTVNHLVLIQPRTRQDFLRS